MLKKTPAKKSVHCSHEHQVANLQIKWQTEHVRIAVHVHSVSGCPQIEFYQKK